MWNRKFFNGTPKGVPREGETMQQVWSHGSFRQSVQEGAKTAEHAETTAAAGKLGRGRTRRR